MIQKKEVVVPLKCDRDPQGDCLDLQNLWKIAMLLSCFSQKKPGFVTIVPYSLSASGPLLPPKPT